MKLYQILNENYLGKKFKVTIDGIEGEWIRVVTKNGSGKYGYEMDYSGIWSLNEGILLHEVELMETDEDKYDRYYKEAVVVRNEKCIGGYFSIDISPYNILKYAKEYNLLSMAIKDCDKELFVHLSFEQLQELYDRGLEIKEIFDKIKQNKK